MTFRGGRFLLIVALTVVGVAVGLGLTNWNYLTKGTPSGAQLGSDRIGMINWQETGPDQYRSLEDCQIVLSGIQGEVHRILLQGEFPHLEQTNAQVYYTLPSNGGFAEENSMRLEPEATETGIAISMPAIGAVKDIRIDLTDAIGYEIRLQGVTLYPFGFDWDWFSILAGAMTGILLGWFFSVPFSSFKKFPTYLKNFLRFSYLLSNLVKRDITIKYRRSVLGIVWSILNPLLMMMVINAVFQHLFRFNIENFPLYYLTGSLIFNFVSEATTGAMTSITSSAALIRKVYIPKYIFPMEKCMFSFVNMLYSLVATVIMFFVLRQPLSVTFLLLPIPMLYAFVFSVGFGMILTTFNVFFRDTTHLYGVFVTAWVYLTPIIYPIEILPDLMLKLIRLNPLYHYVTYFRQVTLYGVVPDWRQNLVCMFFSVFFLIVGVILFKKKQDQFILYI